MQVESVVDALRRLREALTPRGKLVDTQPRSARPPVFADGTTLGTVDMREWVRTIRAVDAQIERALAEGLFTLEAERSFVVTDTFGNGAECVEVVSEWGGTTIPSRLAARLRRIDEPVTLDAEVRLRLLARGR